MTATPTLIGYITSIIIFLIILYFLIRTIRNKKEKISRFKIITKRKTFIILATALVILNILDLTSTKHFLEKGFIEGNYLFYHLFNNIGFTQASAIKIITVMSAVLVLNYIFIKSKGEHTPILINTLLIILNTILLIVVTLNYSL